MDEPQFVETISPDAAFAALAADARVSILRTLWEIDEYTASFSDLREAVGMRDSGQFNYHLDKLIGTYVVKTDDGYELTEAGRQINGRIEAGVFTVDATIEPISLDPPCPVCGGNRTLIYERETVIVECDSCSVTAEFGVPPSVLAGRDRTEIPDVVGRYLITTIQRLVNGFCLYCDGAIDRTVVPLETYADGNSETLTPAIADRIDRLPLVELSCTRCGTTVRAGLSTVLLPTPEVAFWFVDRGIDVRDRAIWEYSGMHPAHQRILDHDPFRASATFHIEAASLTVVVDENLQIHSIEA